MQALTAAPRDGLTSAQVLALLKADNLTVSGGLELLSPTLALVADVSGDLTGGSVSRSMDAVVHGTCKVLVSRAFAWGTDLIRPYVTLSSPTTTARFNLGVFCLVTPETQVGETPVTYDVTGYDRIYLLAREVGNSYQVSAGTEYLAAVRQVITDAGLTGVLLDGSATGKTLPQTRTWPLLSDQGGSPTTWLQIVNDLLSAINYRGLYADQDGLLRSEPYAEPAARSVEFTFDADELRTIVGQDRRVMQDQFRSPNRWVFVQQNVAGSPPPEPVTGAGIYTVDNLGDGPSSQSQRGLVWAKVTKLDAADQSALVAQGDRIVAADRRVTTTLTVTTGLVPTAGHFDVLSYSDLALGGTRKVQAVSWSLDLTGADMTWTWEQVG